MPHDCVIESLSSKEVGGTALLWFSSFFTSRTQQVKVGQVLSVVSNVTSGVIQGSVLGSVLFTVSLDLLLRRLKHQATAFADDLKFGADVAVSSRDEVQGDIDVVCEWSDENNMSLSTEKYLVVHCGNNQPNHAYHLRGFPLKSVNDFRDLGVQRLSNEGYTSHIATTATRASTAAGAILTYVVITNCNKSNNFYISPYFTIKR